MGPFRKRRLFDLGRFTPATNPSLEDRVEALEKQNDVLQELVVTLLVEVEALRSVAIEEAADTPDESEYASSYRQAALLKHNAAGVLPGFVKLAGLFADDDPDLGELNVLRRLGYSEEQIAEYREKVREVRTYT